MTHVVVIGAGVVGTSVAYRLAQAGAKVTVVDAGEPGSGTTGSSFAWVNANQKTPREYFELNVAGIREHDELAAELGHAPWLHRTGNLMWTGDPVRYDELCQRVDRLKSWGYNAQWLSAEEVNRSLEPNVHFSGPSMRVAWFPDEGWLHGPTYVRELIGKAAELGATIRTGSQVTFIDISDQGCSVQLSDSSRIPANAVVNAAGPGADSVASLVGRTLPLGPTRGLLVQINASDNPINRVIQTAEVNLRPDGDGYLLITHDSIDPLIGELSSVPLDDDHVRELCKRARRIVPDIQPDSVTETRVGVRPYPRDGVSCIGSVSGLPGYFEAVTHSGMTLGPVIGRILAKEIIDGEADPLTRPFRPDRFR